MCILRTNEDSDSVFRMHESVCILRTSEDSDMKSSAECCSGMNQTNHPEISQYNSTALLLHNKGFGQGMSSTDWWSS